MNPIAAKALERATHRRQHVSLAASAMAPDLESDAGQSDAVLDGSEWTAFHEGPTSRNADKFVARLPDGMRAQISEVAAADERSMNSFVVTALRNELAGRKEQALLLEALALLKRQLTEALASVPGGQQ